MNEIRWGAVFTDVALVLFGVAIGFMVGRFI